MTRRRIDLPTPPSLNHAYHDLIVPAKPGRKARSMRVLTEQGKAYVATVRVMLRRAGWAPMSGAVGWSLVWRRERRSGDLTNRYKILEDACNGYAWADDSQVVVHGPNFRVDGAPNPGVTLEVWAVVDEPPEDPPAAVEQRALELSTESSTSPYPDATPFP